jgi:hypothetical protein
VCACRWRDSLPLSGWSDLLDTIATSLTLDVVWEGLLLNLAISGIEVRLESDGILIRYAAVCAIENKGNLAIRELDAVLGCAVYCLAYPSASMLLDKKLTEGRSVSLHKCFEAPVIERGKLKSTSIDVLKEFSATFCLSSGSILKFRPNSGLCVRSHFGYGCRKQVGRSGIAAAHESGDG